MLRDCLFALHKLYLSLLQPPEATSKEESLIPALKAVHRQPLKFLTFFCFVLAPSSWWQNLPRETPPEWMAEQIEKDLQIFQGKSLSLKKMQSTFSAQGGLFIKVQIKKNHISYEYMQEIDAWTLKCRFSPIYKSLCKFAKFLVLPDVTFFLTLHDAWGGDCDLPLFVFAKNQKIQGHILFPDYDSFGGNYQVFPGKDVTQFAIPWKKKKKKLIWRGATSQSYYTQENFQQISRVVLCQMAQAHPKLIDAKFTIYAQGAEDIPQMQQYKGERIPYEEIFKHKYQMWIDGNTVSYTASGWRLFSNSVIFKPDSENIQWYFGQLKPWVHYVPIKVNLEDLVEKIKMIKANDAYAEKLAKNAREFACSHLTTQESMRYFYHLLWAYSKLDFVD